MGELLPCPFCGSSAEIKEDCGTFEPGCSHCGSFFGFHSTREHAAKSWNRRASPSEAEVERAADGIKKTLGEASPNLWVHNDRERANEIYREAARAALTAARGGAR